MEKTGDWGKKIHFDRKNCFSSKQSSEVDQQSLKKTGDVRENLTNMSGKIAFPVIDPV